MFLEVKFPIYLNRRVFVMSQKNDLVLAELLQVKFDLNRHINSHCKKAQTLTRKHIQPAFYINIQRVVIGSL